MSIPDYQDCMLPLLRIAEEGKAHKLSEAVESISKQFNLTKEERETLTPSGTQYTIHNRVGWARTYLKKAGLLSDPQKGYFQITDEGKKLLATNPSEVRSKTLKQYKPFKEFLLKSKMIPEEDEEAIETPLQEKTPEEAMEWGYQRLAESLADEILERIASCSASFFEKLVVDLLVRMGYGGTFKEAAQIVGKSGDEGVDGIIKEDRLGLDTIYVQAKRWENSVSRPEIQKFAGALLGKKAKKGIFITTSTFTKEAREYADGIEAKIVLVDGDTLAKYMIEKNLGINTNAIQTYEIKRIDSDYFSEE